MSSSRQRCVLERGIRLMPLFNCATFYLIACNLLAQPLPQQLGDLDADGRITVIDLQKLLNHLGGSQPSTLQLSTQLLPFADVNEDGYLNQDDVARLRDAILGTPIPVNTRPVALEPATGSSEVGVTVRPKAIFPKPIDIATLNSNNFYATFAGRRLAATITPANNGTFAWLFFHEPMPNASQVQVIVDGSTLRTRTGLPLDVDGDGALGGVVRFSFSTVSVVGIPGTVLSSRIVDPGPDLIPRTADDVIPGFGFNYRLPISGVRVHVLGQEQNFAYTGTNGIFTLSNMPVGNVKVVLDGRTASNAPAGYYFPEMVMDTTFEPGITNGVMDIVDANGNVVRDANGVPVRALAMYLPRVASNVLQTVSATNTTLITLQSNAAYTLSPTQQQYLTIEIQPGSLTGMNGQPLATGQVGVSVVPPELVRDMLPPGILQHTFDITVQAPGVATFSTPAPMTFPNVFNAAPGTKLNFLSFDHTTGRLVIDGTATVSADGLYVTTDPGTGITRPGWHGLAPPGNSAKGNSKNTKPSKDRKKNEDGKDLPDGVERQRSDVKLKDVDPTLLDELDEMRDAFRDALDEDDYTLQVTSGHRDGNGGSRHDHNTAVDLGARDSEGNYFDNETFDDVGQELRDQLTDDLGEGGFRIGARYPDGTKPPWADFLDPNPYHYHVDLGKNSDYSPQRRQFFMASSTVDSTNTGFNPSYGRVFDPSGSFELLFRLEPSGEFDQLFVPSTRLLTIQLFDEISGGLLQKDFWSGPSGQSILPLAQTSQDFIQYYQFLTNQIAGSMDLDLEELLVIPELGPSEFTFLSDDSDNDMIPDIGEQVIGTNPLNSDSDGDGLSDFAEIQQGLDPLSGRGFPTGLIASLPLAGAAKEVVMQGSILDSAQQTAYVALGSRGLGIVDASRFQMSILLGQLDLPGDATDVAVDADLAIAVLAANVGGLHFVTVTNTAQPVRLFTIPGSVNQVEVANGVAYSAFGTALRAYDLLTGELIETLPLGGGAIAGLAREGTFLYTMDSSPRLQVIDIRGANMVPRGTLAMPAGGGKLFVGGGIAYVAAGNGNTGGFATANVSNPDNPTLISGVDANNVEGQAIAVNGSGLAVTVGTLGLFGGGVGTAVDVMNISDPANTGAFLTRFNLSTAPFSVAIGGGIAFVADGTAGLQVVNYRSFDNQGVAPTLNVTPPIDLDTNAPGIQVEAGSVITIGAQVSDDVQVRNVELLLDGQVVVNDVSFPWDLSARAPLLNAGKNTATLQVRAMDTGGNSVTSPIITVMLVPDLTPPRVKRTHPAPGSILGSLDLVGAYFSEPFDPTSIATTTLMIRHGGDDGIIGTGDDTFLTTGTLTYREDLNAVFLNFPRNLAPGIYQAVINPPVADLAGNVLAVPYNWQFWVVGGRDSDHDGIPDDIELALGLDPDNPSSLGDGVLDGDRDADSDGLSNKWELLFGYDPRNPDSDGNTILDGNEDPDRDSLTNAQEQGHRTHPRLADSDADGWSDEPEVNFGGNPLDPRVGPRLFVTATPSVTALVTGPGQFETASLGTVVAQPPTTVLVPGAGSIDAISLGTIVAQPSVSVLVPGLASFDAVTLGVVIAQPPLNLLVPGQGPLDSFSLGTVAAQPPITLLAPGLGAQDSVSLGTVIAQPPLNLLVPGTGGVEALTLGTMLALPPVSIQINPQ